MRLGETAPLLLIGMNAFIPSVESMGVLEPATTLPTQIFSWADSPERGFVSRTSAAILVLLGFLVIMNMMAIVLSKQIRTEVVEGDCVMEAKVEAQPVIQVQPPVLESAEHIAGRQSSDAIKMAARDVMRVLRREAGAVRRRSSTSATAR